MKTILDDHSVQDGLDTRNGGDARNRVLVPTQWAVTLLSSLALLLTLSWIGCGSQNLAPGSVDAGQTTGSYLIDTDTEVAIVVGGREITVAEIDEHMKSQFMLEFRGQPADRQFAMRENAARDLMQKIVIEGVADKRGISPEELYEEIADGVADPTEEDIEAWYKANHSRLQGRRLEDVEGQIGQHLMNESRTQALTDFLDPRFASMSMRVVLSPPRVELAATRLSRGATDARVTITSFSDYQCPYCILAEPVLSEVLSRYPDNVRIVHRHFPLESLHAFARPAAEASMCADEQGKFWEYHQAIFDLSGKLAENSLAQIGEDLGLDTDKLKSCIEERRFKDFVDADFNAGRAIGVTGTPAFYINGIVFDGSRDADEMSRQVDLELARIEDR